MISQVLNNTRSLVGRNDVGLLGLGPNKFPRIICSFELGPVKGMKLFSLK